LLRRQAAGVSYGHGGVLSLPSVLLRRARIEDAAIHELTHGKTLLAHAKRFAATQSCGAMRLYTNSLFTENLRLYEQLGYVESHHETNIRGLIVHMQKALATAT
jgi:GNAT superfamily N-acetyltransferase